MPTSIKIRVRIKLNDLLFLIVTLSLYELFIGGGGRFFEIGPLTLRMYIFFFLLAMGTFYIMIKGSIDKIILGLFCFFLLTIVVSTTFGIINNAELNLLFEDIKPLLYFMSILYLHQVITYDNIPKIIRIIKISGLILAVAYIILIILLMFQYLNYRKFYSFISTSKEVMFRGSEGLFFYKGFLYLNIAFFFYFFSKSAKSKLISFFVATAIVLTLTRGFIFSLAICLFFYFVFLNKNIYKKLGFILLSIIGVVIYAIYIIPLLGDKTISNSIRLTQIREVIDSTTIFSFFLGHGFGIGVPVRPIHMEISFLEIFHKQGLLGLMFWFSLFGIIVYYYGKIRTTSPSFNPDAFFIGTLFIYIQTFTNPFLNNPIGMTFVIITLLVFKTIYQHTSHDFSLHSDIQR